MNTALAYDPQALNYEVRNPLGLCIYTSNEPRLARRFARINAPKLGDLTIHEVQIVKHDRKLTTVRAPVPALSRDLQALRGRL